MLRKKHVDKGCQKPISSASKAGIDALNTASKRVMKKTDKASSDLIDNKIGDKIREIAPNRSSNS